MGKMHDRLKMNQAKQNKHQGGKEAITEICNSIGDLFSNYGYFISFDFKEDYCIIYVSDIETASRLNNPVSKDEAKKSFNYLEESEFRILSNKMNGVKTHSSDFMLTVSKIIEVNIHPLQHKEEFNQLFKQPTKRKEFCL